MHFAMCDHYMIGTHQTLTQLGEDIGQNVASRDDQLRYLHRQSCFYFESQGMDHMQAQDLATETCLRWLSQREKMRCTGIAWLRTVQRHLLVDQLRRQARERRLLQCYAKYLENDNAGLGNTPASELLERLDDLLPSDREILVEFYVEGLHADELAQRLSLTTNCVKQRLCRARSRLLRLLCNTKQIAVQ